MPAKNNEHVCEPLPGYAPPISRCWREHIPEILAHLDHYKPVGAFCWPDDGLANRIWQYDFHAGWVSAWNAEDRQTEIVAFIRRWITEESNGYKE